LTTRLYRSRNISILNSCLIGSYLQILRGLSQNSYSPCAEPWRGTDPGWPPQRAAARRCSAGAVSGWRPVSRVWRIGTFCARWSDSVCAAKHERREDAD